MMMVVMILMMIVFFLYTCLHMSLLGRVIQIDCKWHSGHCCGAWLLSERLLFAEGTFYPSTIEADKPDAPFYGPNYIAG